MSYKEFISYFPKFDLFKPLFDRNLISCKSWNRGEYVVRYNWDFNNLIFFTSGIGKVYRPLSNGNEIIYAIYGKGEIAGDVEFILKRSYSCSIRCFEELHGYIVPSKYITGSLKDELIKLFSVLVAEKLLSNTRKQAIRAGFDLESRLSYQILYNEYLDRLTMDELSASLGVSYRHLSRVFNSLTSRGFIERKKGGIRIINREGLEELSEPLLLESI